MFGRYLKMLPEDTFAICDKYCDEEGVKNGEKDNHSRINGHRNTLCVLSSIRLQFMLVFNSTFCSILVTHVTGIMGHVSKIQFVQRATLFCSQILPQLWRDL